VKAWYGRAVLALAALLMVRIGVGYVVDPVSAVAPHAIVLGSPEAITMMRVSGGLFLALALLLGVCAAVPRHLVAGLVLLSTIASVLLVVRIVGLVVDGDAPFTRKVLVPEVALVLLSTTALILERRHPGRTALDER